MGFLFHTFYYIVRYTCYIGARYIGVPLVVITFLLNDHILRMSFTDQF